MNILSRSIDFFYKYFRPFGIQPLIAILYVCCGVAISGTDEWTSEIPAEQRHGIAMRLDVYVKANRSQDWNNLFEFISDAGRGGTHRQNFVTVMKASHRRDFSNSPDLQEFQPVRTTKSATNEYDIYGCAKAQREGREFNGIALIHAVFEHNGWFFSGWSFTEFPNEPCKDLSDPSWETPKPVEWNQPMEELREASGVPFHVN